MEELIPFLVFAAIVLINLARAARARSAGKRPPLSRVPPRAPPPGMEDFFEELAGSFRRLPDKEGEEDPSAVRSIVDPPPRTPSPGSTPPPGPVAPPDGEPVFASRRSARRGRTPPSLGALPAIERRAFQQMPLMRSPRSGTLYFPLRNRKTLRRAIIADIVFSPPRACDPRPGNTFVA